MEDLSNTVLLIWIMAALYSGDVAEFSPMLISQTCDYKASQRVCLKSLSTVHLFIQMSELSQKSNQKDVDCMSVYFLWQPYFFMINPPFFIAEM